MTNPFVTKVATGDAFCNRKKEILELARAALGHQNIVFYAPRRYGKTSLVTRVLDQLHDKKMLVAYIDVSSVTNEEDLCRIMAKGIYEGFGKKINQRSFLEQMKDLFTKIYPAVSLKGESVDVSIHYDSSITAATLLTDIMTGIQKYVAKKGMSACIVFDEFQRITQLPNALQIESTLRSHIQFQQNVAYFFVGSQRHMLVDIFETRNRPFYNSANRYHLNKIDIADMAAFVIDRFSASKKNCPQTVAEKLFEMVDGVPYFYSSLHGCFGMLRRSQHRRIRSTMRLI